MQRTFVFGFSPIIKIVGLKSPPIAAPEILSSARLNLHYEWNSSCPKMNS